MAPVACLTDLLLSCPVVDLELPNANRPRVLLSVLALRYALLQQRLRCRNRHDYHALSSLIF